MAVAMTERVRVTEVHTITCRKHAGFTWTGYDCHFDGHFAVPGKLACGSLPHRAGAPPPTLQALQVSPRPQMTRPDTRPAAPLHARPTEENIRELVYAFYDRVRD